MHCIEPCLPSIPHAEPAHENKIHIPYGSDETGREGVIRKPKEQATLSHTCQNKSPCFQPLKNA
jgi:hypothetical protein